MDGRRFVVLATCLVVCLAAPCPADEYDVLMDFFNSTGGGSWKQSRNWGNRAVDCGSWDGLDADYTTGKVVNMYLSGNGLTGTIPSSLSKLTSLSRFEVAGNSLRGAVPDVSTWTSLQFLKLELNYLTTFDKGISQPPALTLCDMSNNTFACPLPLWAQGEPPFGCGAVCT